MSKYNRSILVLLDGTPASESALPWSTYLARHLGCVLNLCYVGSREFDAADRGIHPEAHLERLARPVRSQMGVGCQVLSASGKPLESALDLAAGKSTLYASLAIDRHATFARWIGHDFASQLIRRAPVPILLQTSRAGGPTDAWCDPGGPILVPLDGSQQAERAIEFAVPIARRLHQELCLVQAWGPPNVVAESVFALGAPVVTSDTPYLGEAAYEYSAKLSQAYLADLACWLESQGIPATWEARSALVGRYIREVAENRRASMVVMTSRARAGIGRFFLGSLTDAVVRATGLPVLIVGPRAVPDHLRPLDPRLAVALMGNGLLN